MVAFRIATPGSAPVVVWRGADERYAFEAIYELDGSVAFVVGDRESARQLIRDGAVLASDDIALCGCSC